MIESAARLLLVTLAVVLGCGVESDFVAGSRDEPLTLDLSERFVAADVYRAGEIRNWCGPGAEAHLTAGWHGLTPGDREAGRRWTMRRDAVVEVPIVAPREATLRLELAPVPAVPVTRAFVVVGPPPQSVRLLWNGHTLGDFPLPPGAGAIEIPLPADRQRVGPNRLELLPSYWLGPGEHAIAGDARTLGVACRRIELQMSPPMPPPAAPGALLGEASIVQLPESVVTFHLELPRAAHLVGDAVLGAATGAPRYGPVAIALLTADGGERMLVSQTIDASAGGRLHLDADLSDAAGQLAGLSFAFGGGDAGSAGAGTGPALEWRELRIEGQAPEPLAAPDGIPRGRYNVFVVVLDSLRADHVEPNGAAHVETPSMTRLADAGVTFLEARSNASWTRPAVASLLTSLYPPAHGIYEKGDRLARTLPYLPEQLRELGYRTVAVTSNAMVSRTFGFGRGFGRMHPHYRLVNSGWSQKHSSPEARASFVWKRYIEPALSRRPAKPFFVYLHEMDPHSPYDAAEPYRDMYDFGYRGNITSDLRTIQRIRSDPTWAAPMDIHHLNARYRGEITYMDRYLGWMLERLDAAELAQRTLFILTSDHGEEFMDHGSIGHGQSVYEELVRIPLLMRLPGVLPAGRRLRVGAELVDLAPTIMDLIGEEVPVWMEGESLLPYLNGVGGDRSRRPSFAFSSVPRHSSVRLGDWKLILEHGDADGLPDRHLLFDLARDPEESTDRWASEPVVGHALRQLLVAELRTEGARARDVERVELDQLAPDVIESLKALGYLE